MDGIVGPFRVGALPGRPRVGEARRRPARGHGPEPARIEPGGGEERVPVGLGRSFRRIVHLRGRDLEEDEAADGVQLQAHHARGRGRWVVERHHAPRKAGREVVGGRQLARALPVPVEESRRLEGGQRMPSRRRAVAGTEVQQGLAVHLESVGATAGSGGVAQMPDQRAGLVGQRLGRVLDRHLPEHGDLRAEDEDQDEHRRRTAEGGEGERRGQPLGRQRFGERVAARQRRGHREGRRGPS